MSIKIAGENKRRTRRVLSVWLVALAVGWTVPAVAGPGEDLIAAAARGDVAAVQALLANGADVNTKIGPITALSNAVEKGNLFLVKLLVESGAEITPNAIFFADDKNQLSSYTENERGIAAYLISTQAARNGLKLSVSDQDAQVKFLNQTRSAISDYVKNKWPGIPGTERVVVRFVYIVKNTETPNSVWASCDIAIVTKTGMYEIVSKTRKLNAMPDDLEKRFPPLEHAWMSIGNNSSSVSTVFDRKAIQLGNFLLEQDQSGAVSARYVEYK